METLELNNMTGKKKISMDELNSRIEVTEEMDDNFPNLAKYIKPTDTRI